MSTEAFIRCEGVVKIYKIANLEVFALQGLDMNVNQGELVGIVGASGSGKSTLMNILGGLDRPSAGRVWVEGEDLLKMSDFALNRYRSYKVGFVWQQGARNLIPYLTALENVKLPMTLTGRTKGNMTRRAEELLETVGLTSRRHHRLAELSGGEQQRVAIAVSLSNQPRLLLADEPTGELDSSTAAGIFKIFQDLTRNLGLTTVIVSHDAGIARHVDRVVSIRDGKTSSETTRQTSVVEAQEGQTAPAVVEETFEEVILLDAAGRLQVPREYLEHFQIKRRVTVEMAEEGILIKRAGAAQQEGGEEKAVRQELLTERGWKGWFKRLGKR
jgi:putative ABC transport system ATP-binding protein